MQYLVIDGITIPLKGGISGGTGGPAYSDADIYSTEEQMIGYWIDKKPLYRKIFQVTSPATSSDTATTEVAAYSANVETVVDVRGIIYPSSGHVTAMPYRHTSSEWAYVAYNVASHASYPNSLRMAVGSSRTNTPCTITLEYTKTTDSPVESIPTASSLMSTMVTEGLNNI